jgi:hypothetical protein
MEVSVCRVDFGALILCVLIISVHPYSFGASTHGSASISSIRAWPIYVAAYEYNTVMYGICS